MFEPIVDINRVTTNTATKFMTVPNLRTKMDRRVIEYRGPTNWNSINSESEQLKL